LQPSQAALLSHHAVRPPRGECVVEAFIRRSDGLLARERHARVVETGEIAHPEIIGRRHDPRIAAAAQRVAKPSVVLEQKKRVRAQCRIHGVPVDRIGKIDIEIRDHRLPLNRHVRWRGEVCAFDVLHLTNQGLLRRATGARIPLDSALIDHQGECKARVSLSFGHDRLRSLINRVVGTVPVNDYAIDSPADHVVDLALDLPGVGGVVANIHMLGASEPQKHMGINLGCGAGIKQRVDIDLTYISRAAIAIRLI
jgi:hypothetical protein